MDCVQGELLIYRLRRCPEMKKEILFEWTKQLLGQLEQFHRCCNGQSYRYINPYSIVITKEEKLLLLDLEAEGNEFALKNMQKRAMRKYFIKPAAHIGENSRIAPDLYGYGKTIQFILANVQAEPPLTKREEKRLEKIICKCLCENPKKQYEDLKQIQKELPSGPEKFRTGQKHGLLWNVLVVSLILVSALLFVETRRLDSEKRQMQKQSENFMQKQAETQEEIPGKESEGKTEEEENMDVQEYPGFETYTEARGDGAEMQMGERQDSLEEIEKRTAALEDYLLRNTAQDNLEIIEQGERLKREILRYLAAAYDRAGMNESALEAYKELCRTEVQDELLSAVYLRRIALEMEQDIETAFQTGKEAADRFPELRSSEIMRDLEERYALSERESINGEKEAAGNHE